MDTQLSGICIIGTIFAKLDQQLRPFQNLFFLKVHQLLNQFLNTFSNQNSYFQTFRNHYTEIQQKRKTYDTLIKLCIELQDHYQSLLQNLRKQEDYSKVFSISESENRIYKKKKLRQQLQELQPLRVKSRSTLLSYRNDLFYHEIIFIFFVQEVIIIPNHSLKFCYIHFLKAFRTYKIVMRCKIQSRKI